MKEPGNPHVPTGRGSFCRGPGLGKRGRRRAAARRKWTTWTGLTFAIVAALVSVLYWQTHLRVPGTTPLPHLQVAEELTQLPAPGDAFSFSVMGDMPFDTDARRAVLKDAQSYGPLFLCNTGDVVRFAKPKNWRLYMDFLANHLNGRTPYFHCPGNHDVDHNVFGKQPGFFKHYFGRMRRVVDVGDHWRLVFLNTSSLKLSGEQRVWLGDKLKEGSGSNRRILIFTHVAPRLEMMDPAFKDEDEKNHAMKTESTHALDELIANDDVAVVFAGHFNRPLHYKWENIPVYATGMNENTWVTESTAYYRVHVDGLELTVETVELKKPENAP